MSNMTSMEVSSLGFKLNYSVPADVDTYDTLAKKTGACLESAILNVVYRSTFAEFRALFLAAVVNNTGISRDTEPVVNKDGSQKVEVTKNEDGTETSVPITKYKNTEAKDFDKICATLVGEGKFASLEAAQASFAGLAQSVLDGIVFDPSATERQPAGPKTIAKQYIDVAKAAEAKGTLDALASMLSTKLGNWTVLATVDSVSRAISEDQRRIREAKNFSAEYGV